MDVESSVGEVRCPESDVGSQIDFKLLYTIFSSA